jgi:hypothetical protein
MSLFGRRLDTLTETDLRSLIDSSFGENRVIEYKATLPGRTDGEKKEFIKDVVSFANSAGGHIIYGMEASGGVPTAFRGIAGDTIDVEKLRLEQMARTGIEPIIHGFKIEAVALPTAGGNALVIEIPRGLFGPHVIRGRGAFVSRNSAGKTEMDFGEIRAAFIGAETASAKLKDFHAERTARLIAGDTLFPLQKRTIAVLHLLPLEAFTPGFRCDLSRITGGTSRKLLELRGTALSWNARFSLDGFAQIYTPGVQNTPHYAYAHAFRNGALEYADGEIEWGPAARTIRIGLFECLILAATSRFLVAAKELELRGPFFAFPSILNVRGWKLIQPSDGRSQEHDARTIDREHLILPEVMLDGDSVDLETVFRPTFDVLWNACRWARSFNYDDNGVYLASKEWREL